MQRTITILVLVTYFRTGLLNAKIQYQCHLNIPINVYGTVTLKDPYRTGHVGVPYVIMETEIGGIVRALVTIDMAKP